MYIDEHNFSRCKISTVHHPCAQSRVSLLYRCSYARNPWTLVDASSPSPTSLPYSHVLADVARPLYPCPHVLTPKNPSRYVLMPPAMPGPPDKAREGKKFVDPVGVRPSSPANPLPSGEAAARITIFSFSIRRRRCRRRHRHSAIL